MDIAAIDWWSSSTLRRAKRAKLDGSPTTFKYCFESACFTSITLDVAGTSTFMNFPDGLLANRRIVLLPPGPFEEDALSACILAERSGRCY
eukprot:1560121-Rhodomonas_salina.3